MTLSGTVSLYHYHGCGNQSPTCRQRVQHSDVHFVFNLKRLDHVSAYWEAVNVLMCCVTSTVVTDKDPQNLCQGFHIKTRFLSVLHMVGSSIFQKKLISECKNIHSYFYNQLYVFLLSLND